jgi:hypothetical protein
MALARRAVLTYSSLRTSRRSRRQVCKKPCSIANQAVVEIIVRLMACDDVFERAMCGSCLPHITDANCPILGQLRTTHPLEMRGA